MAAGLNLAELVPGLLGPYLKFFRAAHEEGVVPARLKELARLRVAALNDCDT
jgi:alkylhydroperoxidase family enzyme